MVRHAMNIIESQLAPGKLKLSCIDAICYFMKSLLFKCLETLNKLACIFVDC